MFDIQLLRKDIQAVADRLASRGMTLDTARIATLEAERKDIQTQTQDMQAKRNGLSKQIGIAKGKGEDTASIMAEVAGLGDALKGLEDRLEGIQGEFNQILMTLPNLPHESVPNGKGEADNVELRRVGEPRRFDFPVKDHVDLGESLELLDFATAAKIA
ncbi:MAG: serine--tRNA ligase, partial [Betaproteobacteria bacterium]|nr:serine--tRNA ligase [Betaproteobacteria bacterium]